MQLVASAPSGGGESGRRPGWEAFKILTALVGGAATFAIGSDLAGAALREACGLGVAAMAGWYLGMQLLDRPRGVPAALVTSVATVESPAPLMPRASSEFRGMIRLSREHLMRIASASADPHAAGIALEIGSICAAASRLVTQVMDAVEPRLTHANSLETMLESTENVIFRYLALEAGTLIAEADRRCEIRREIVDELLPAIVEALHDFGRRLDEPELLELQASIRAVTTHLKLEGL